MSKKILIDAAIQEETRLVILNGQKIEAFETETQSEIKGNIYLARITRVEPSLQAAFVEYGGNRHGFLAFPEIHPDYFQIPIVDRPPAAPEPKAAAAPKASSDDTDNKMEDLLPSTQEDDFYNVDGAGAENSGGDDDAGETQTVTSTKNPQDDFYKKYNIQEVVKSGQVLLVQITKEERGNKGAALTTFLSLAGRYCVLMPNTKSSGGVSRKLGQDTRNKIRDLVDDLSVPEGMSLIVRTAGAQQPKEDIERDFEYLTRLWDSIRDLTLESNAPSLIFEEGNLVQRALRDFVKKDVGAIIIDGKAAYQKAKQYMEKLMPQQCEILQEHSENKPLFVHYKVEELLNEMLQPQVRLKSGGYIVINPTEALVAVDVNSGKATSEHNIENTAYKTNLEAADEVARQARLRDLGGLIVIDFIDMEAPNNIRDVERRIRDAVRHDRAKVQTGRISSNFGLLEMSRQRLSPEISEGRTEECATCGGSGQSLTPQTIALRALREGISLGARMGKNREVVLRLDWRVVLYLLNERKDELQRIEKEQGIKLHIEARDIDNPNKPWQLDTRKITPTEDREKESSAINMETAYTQMAAPSTEQKQERGERQDRGDRQDRGERGDRQKSPRNRNRNQKKKQHGQSERQGQRQRTNNQNKDRKQPAKEGGEAKPSIWNRFLGKKK